MLKVRGFVSFDAPFNTEPISDDKEHPPGLDLVEYIVKALNASNLKTTEINQHDSYGWYFYVKLGENTIWCMLQLSDNWLLISESEVPFLKRLFRKEVADLEHQCVCESIDCVLQDGQQFKNILWFTQDEFQSQAEGSAHP